MGFDIKLDNAFLVAESSLAGAAPRATALEPVEIHPSDEGGYQAQTLISPGRLSGHRRVDYQTFLNAFIALRHKAGVESALMAMPMQNR